MPPLESLQPASMSPSNERLSEQSWSAVAGGSLAHADKPRDRYGRQRRLAMRHHVLVLCGALAVLVAARWLQLQDATHVRLGGTSWLLPELCSMRRWWGVPCPGCGLTRSFVCLARGDVWGAWHFNPAGPLLFGLLLVQFPYRAIQIGRLAKRKRELDWNLLPWMVIGVGLVMLAQWIWRVGFHMF